MRRYVHADYLAANPHVAETELVALGIAERTDVVTPAPLAGDAHARHCDVPTVVMTMLQGRPVWEPKRRRDWLQQMADALIDIHNVTVPAETLPSIERYAQSRYEPPRWADQPAVWHRAIEIFHGPVPQDDVGFVHRDFHPGNLLWKRGSLTGVVDWQAACIGPVSIDVSHCRLNFALYEPELAEELRLVWEQRAARRFDPWADVMSIIGFLDNLREQPPNARARRALEDMLGRAVAELSS